VLSVLAVLAVRNESIHLPGQLDRLLNDQLDIAIIDNGSDDGSREICEEFQSKGSIKICDQPWTGEFSLHDQLRLKADIIRSSNHDWVVHVDADEWLQTPKPGQSLLDGLEEADAGGANCVNFNEFVFVPMVGEDFYQTDYVQQMRRYYFFQPAYPRLMRAWKRSANVSNIDAGGHKLSGTNVQIHPVDFNLRHYIALSEEHVMKKYVGRKFSREDLESGWHFNRLGIRPDQLRLRNSNCIFQLNEPTDRAFEKSSPTSQHFWEWS
jgi:glycosyltransferase involved in cell wall biosynthesis